VSIEERLRAFMTRQARVVDPVPDWNDLDNRVRRSGRRRGRVLAAGLALMLVAGSAAGFVIGRATGSRDEAPSIEARPIPRNGGPGLVESTPQVPLGGGVPPDIGPIFSGTGSVVFPEPLERVFLRTTEDGIAVRVYRAVGTGYEGGCYGRGCAPAECYPTSSVFAELSNELAVGQGWGGYYDQPLAPVVASSGFIGVSEGSPAAWAVVQVGRDVARVRATFAEGAVDEMEPVAGVAVLAHHVTVPEQADATPSEAGYPFLAAGGTVEALDASGNVLATKELGAASSSQEVLALPECAPPPPPPTEPNGPPPENAEDARQAVIDAYTAVYSAATPDEDRAANVDDPAGIAEGFAEARTNFQAALDVVSVRIDEVIFINPSEATVRYDIVLPGYSIPEFPDLLGGAVMVEGRWKVTRTNVCDDLALAAVRCDP
jgi:hypothetical protein